MKGRYVELVRPADADYELMASWLGPASPTAVLTMDTGESVTPQALRQADESGAVRQFAVRDLDGGRTVGVVNYRRHGSPGCYVIGGAIGDPSLWRRGLGAEAFQLLIDHLFHHLNAHRMQFNTAVFNKAILQMAIRAGFVLDGILREHHFMDGRYHDVAVWSLLRREYYEAVAILAEKDPSLPGPDLIPEEEKAAALEVFRAHLAGADSEQAWRLLLDGSAWEAAR